MIVPVQVEPRRIGGPTIDSYLGYLEPEVRDNMGLVVAHTVAPVKDGCTVARLLNPTDQEMKLHPGSHLGVFHHVLSHEIKTQQDGLCGPPHNMYTLFICLSAQHYRKGYST